MSPGRDYLRYDGMGLASLVARGELHPTELLEEALRRAEAVNPRLGAMVLTMEEEARRQIAQGETTGPLGGVPFALKDLRAQYAGTPASSGSRFFAGSVADYDTETVRRHRAAGLVIFGKTKTPELGCNLATEPRWGGPARNPWDTALIPGGSSGGAAALVAARVIPLAHATDGGGSIRIPATCCGLFGLKPTRGRTPAGPDRGEGWGGLSTEHAVTLTVRDSALLLDATAGPDPGAPYYPPPPSSSFLSRVGADPGRLRIGFSLKTPRGHDLHPDCRRATEETARLCEELGHIVEEASPRWNLDEAGAAYSTVVNANVARTVADRARIARTPPRPRRSGGGYQATSGGGKSHRRAPISGGPGRRSPRRERCLPLLRDPSPVAHPHRRRASPATRNLRHRLRRHRAIPILDRKVQSVLLSGQHDRTTRHVGSPRSNLGGTAGRSAFPGKVRGRGHAVHVGCPT